MPNKKQDMKFKIDHPIYEGIEFKTQKECYDRARDFALFALEKCVPCLSLKYKGNNNDKR